MVSTQGLHDHPAMRFTTTRLYSLFIRSRSGRQQSLSPNVELRIFLHFFPFFFCSLYLPSFNLGQSIRSIADQRRYISLLPRSCFVHCRVCIIAPKSRCRPCCRCDPERFFGSKEDLVPPGRSLFPVSESHHCHLTICYLKMYVLFIIRTKKNVCAREMFFSTAVVVYYGGPS